MRLKELMGQRTVKLSRMKAICDAAELENRDLNAAEEVEYAALKAEVDSLSKRMERAREQEEMSRSTGVLAGADDQGPGREDRGNAGRITEMRDLEAERPFRDLGEQLQAVYRAAIHPRDIDKRLLDVVSKEERAASGMNTVVDSEGGFLVQKDFAGVMLDTAVKTGKISSLVDSYPIGANANGATWVDVEETDVSTTLFGGIRVYRRAEAATVTASAAKLKSRELKVESLMGIAYATDEMLEDTTFMTAFFTRAFSEAMARRIDSEIIDGTGVGECLGILRSAALISIAKETGQAADTIKYENVKKMWTRLHQDLRTGAYWGCHPDATEKLYDMEAPVGVGGQKVFLPPTGVAGSMYATLYGRPIVEDDNFKAPGDVGDLVLMVPKQYMLIAKGGVKGETSMHVRFLQGEMAFRFTYRVNGMPKQNHQLTIKNSSNTRSPWIGIAARA